MTRMSDEQYDALAAKLAAEVLQVEQVSGADYGLDVRNTIRSVLVESLSSPVPATVRDATEAAFDRWWGEVISETEGELTKRVMITLRPLCLEAFQVGASSLEAERDAAVQELAEVREIAEDAARERDLND